MSENPAIVVPAPSITGADEVVNPPYEPPPGGADVCPPVVLEEPPDPEVVALIEETALPPDPRDEDPGPPPEPVPAPVNVDVPAVLGTGTVGEILSVTMGNWEGEPTSYAYQWMSGTNATGTTGSAYVVEAADVGKDISCMVTATNAGGSTAVMSNAISVT